MLKILLLLDFHDRCMVVYTMVERDMLYPQLCIRDEERMLPGCDLLLSTNQILQILFYREQIPQIPQNNL